MTEKDAAIKVKRMGDGGICDCNFKAEHYKVDCPNEMLKKELKRIADSQRKRSFHIMGIHYRPDIKGMTGASLLKLKEIMSYEALKCKK